MIRMQWQPVQAFSRHETRCDFLVQWHGRQYGLVLEYVWKKSLGYYIWKARKVNDEFARVVVWNPALYCSIGRIQKRLKYNRYNVKRHVNIYTTALVDAQQDRSTNTYGKHKGGLLNPARRQFLQFYSGRGNPKCHVSPKVWISRSILKFIPRRRNRYRFWNSVPQRWQEIDKSHFLRGGVSVYIILSLSLSLPLQLYFHARTNYLKLHVVLQHDSKSASQANGSTMALPENIQECDGVLCCNDVVCLGVFACFCGRWMKIYYQKNRF